MIFRFDKERFGHAPGMFPDAVKIVTYSEMVMKSYDLGIVYGYDDQEIQLPLKRVMNDNFTLMARRLDENGDFRYDFIKPMRTGEEELGYRLDETNGKIIIYNAGEYLDARLFVAGLATNIGSAGNVLENNEFILMDFGCVYNGYCGDMTRTIHLGKATDNEKDISHRSS